VTPTPEGASLDQSISASLRPSAIEHYTKNWEKIILKEWKKGNSAGS
jgi:hypothetical protein